jgi:hypothetical protein
MNNLFPFFVSSKKLKVVEEFGHAKQKGKIGK